MNVRVFTTLWLLVALGLTQEACSQPGCDSATYTPLASAPTITDMALEYQQETDPWTVIFSIEFKAPSADLGQGQAIFYTGGTQAETLSLSDTFYQSELPLTATSGRLGIHLRFADQTQDGDTVRLGTQLRTAGQVNSNCYAMDLNFGVKPVPQTASRWQQPLYLAARFWDLVKSHT